MSTCWLHFRPHLVAVTNPVTFWVDVSDCLDFDSTLQLQLPIHKLGEQVHLTHLKHKLCCASNRSGISIAPSNQSLITTVSQSLITTVSQWLITDNDCCSMSNHWPPLFPNDPSLITNGSQWPIINHHCFPVTEHWSPVSQWPITHHHYFSHHSTSLLFLLSLSTLFSDMYMQ